MPSSRLTVRAVALLAVSSLGLSACGAGDDSTSSSGPTQNDEGVTTITIGASPTPHAKILEYIDKELAPEAGLDLKIKTFSDYIQPNVQLSEGTLDANYFQHEPYFDQQVKDRGYDFAHYKGIHIEPYGLYAHDIKDPADLPEGATIGISNDPANQGRALKLLETAGLITLKDGTTATNATLHDIAKNPKKLEFKQTKPAQLVRSLQDLDAAVINGNYALQADLIPAKDAILVENGKDNPYANFIAVRAEDKDNKALQKLDELAHSPEVRQYITKTWPEGSVLPAF